MTSDRRCRLSLCGEPCPSKSPILTITSKIRSNIRGIIYYNLLEEKNPCLGLYTKKNNLGVSHFLINVLKCQSYTLKCQTY